MYPLLLVLALLLPFELTEPLFFLGPVGITSVELPLYALLALCGLDPDSWRPSRWTPVHWAALAWAAAHLASAAAAEGDRSLSLRFALRMCAGAALVFPASAATRPRGRPRAVLLALAAGAVLSAAAGLAEVAVAGAGPLLTPFKTVAASVAGTLRASGPFQYPNPAALYWGAALPALLVLRAAAGRRAGEWSRILALICALTLAAAVAQSGSRGALLATAVVWGLLLLVPLSTLRPSAVLALAGLALATAATGLAHPALLGGGSALRERPWFAGRFEQVPPATAMAAGQEIRLRIRARNVGSLPWTTDGPQPIVIGARWLEPSGGLDHEEPSVSSPGLVPPGGAALVSIKVTAPDRPGRYELRFELVAGGTAFEDPMPARVGEAITVVGPASSVARTWPPPRPTQRQPTRPELWRAGWAMWQERPLLGVGPDNFRRLYGAYLGPRPLDDRVNANSLYVETLADLGLLGTAALLFLFLALAHAVRRAYGADDDGDRMVAIASGLALLAFALHGLVDDVLAFTPLYGLFWIHAGLLAGRLSPPRSAAAAG